MPFGSIVEPLLRVVIELLVAGVAREHRHRSLSSQEILEICEGFRKGGRFYLLEGRKYRVGVFFSQTSALAMAEKGGFEAAGNLGAVAGAAQTRSGLFVDYSRRICKRCILNRPIDW